MEPKLVKSTKNWCNVDLLAVLMDFYSLSFTQMK